jgi:uncharacterized protein
LHFEGVFDVGAPRARVFDVVTDPKQVAGCMPDLQRVEIRSPDEFDVVVRVGVSFIRGDFALRFRIVEREPQAYAKLLAHGTGMGSAVDMEIVVRLSSGKGEMTSVNWIAEARVSGKIASLGQRLMETQAQRITKQFFDCFRQKLEKG